MIHSSSFLKKNKPKRFWLVFFILLLVLILSFYASLRWGIPSFSQKELFETLLHPFQESHSQNIIIDIRLPKSIAAVLVGAAFAVSGAIMQGLTRNAIADPGLLGINAGAGLALICAYALFKNLHYSGILLFSLLGALLATVLVFLLSYHPRRGFEQLRLVLSGAMIASLLTAIGQGITLAFNLSTAVIGWQAGGLLGTNWKMLEIIAPFIILGLILSQVFAHQLTILSLNETLAKGLGQKTQQVTFFFLSMVLILSAAAVALVGSLALVGLMIPHFIKSFSGRNYQKILPLSALLGAVFMLCCDLLASYMVGTPLSALVSLAILPSFLYLMRKGAFYEK
ncbi:FecCD family ABC transporter permease [Streptococcus oricebi]|uniref:Iron ABC transporter permease n=1 Tax=Streptococcus oricebi TaxID=1547447 RepID=A0ABS5B3F9_9STRE|nr:iron ABC transporter permease [Streptococcus oricebi]MBP2623372.1 iron ABC transporter permease [Streptococcus oricebi]